MEQQLRQRCKSPADTRAAFRPSMDILLKNSSPEKDTERNEPLREEPNKNLPQYLAATSASIMLMMAGTALGWTSPVLPKLMAHNSTLPVTPDESTWIGSFVAIGAIIAPFPAGLCADLIGRKRALLATALPFMASWCALAVASSVPFLYVGRILAGLGNGWGMTLLPMYVGEIATPSERGAMGVIGQIMITLGFLYVYVLGPLVSYVWLNVCCSLVPMVFFFSFALMPESPCYELSKNNHKRAEKCLAKLRGKTTEGVKAELSALQAAVDESLRSTSNWSDLFTKTASRKAIFLMFGLMLIQQFSGINVVLFYSETIFKKAGSSLSPAIATIVVGVVMFLASFPTPYLIEQLGRRMILILSAVGMMIFQGIIGGFFYLETISYDTSRLAWVPLVSIIGYICLYSVGIGPVPWAMLGEMFAANVRSKGAALSTAFSWALAFVMTKSFGAIVDSLGAHTGFWMFAVFCGAGAVFVRAFLPETKGKTLQEIQDMLNAGTK